MVSSTKHLGLLVPLLTAKDGRYINLVRVKSHFYLAIGQVKLRGSAQVAFSVANSEIRWGQSVPSRTVLITSVLSKRPSMFQIGPRDIGADFAFGVGITLFILRCIYHS